MKQKGGILRESLPQKLSQEHTAVGTCSSSQRWVGLQDRHEGIKGRGQVEGHRALGTFTWDTIWGLGQESALDCVRGEGLGSREALQSLRADPALPLSLPPS